MEFLYVFLVEKGTAFKQFHYPCDAPFSVTQSIVLL